MHVYVKERDDNIRYSLQICGHILLYWNLIQVYIPAHLNMKTVSRVSKAVGMHYLVTENKHGWGLAHGMTVLTG